MKKKKNHRDRDSRSVFWWLVKIYEDGTSKIKKNKKERKSLLRELKKNFMKKRDGERGKKMMFK